MFAFFKTQRDDSHEFRPILTEIEERPLNPLGRMTYWIILAVLLFGVVWMVVGEVDVVVSGRGRFVPDGEVKVLQPLSSGVVRVIGVKEGDYVQQGQILMEIDPSDMEPELESMKTNLLQLNLEKQRLTALLHDTPFLPDKSAYSAEMISIQQEIFNTGKDRLDKQLDVKRQELQQFTGQIQRLREAHSQLENLQEVAETRLHRLEKVKDIISREIFEEARITSEKYRNELVQNEFQQQEARAGRIGIEEQMELIRQDYRNTLFNEYAEKQRQGTGLSARIDQAAFIAARQQIIAPVSGYVAKLLIHTVGGVVTPAEQLLFLVPDNAPMVVKAVVMNRDVGFVAEEMDATVKVDAFDFQKYGFLRGRVRQVSRDSIEDPRYGHVYEVYITPDDLTLTIEGKETRISTGMSLTAEINVGKRRIIEFFIYPLIKYLDEGMSVR